MVVGGCSWLANCCWVVVLSWQLLWFVSLIGLCGGFWQWVVHGGSYWVLGVAVVGSLGFGWLVGVVVAERLVADLGFVVRLWWVVASRRFVWLAGVVVVLWVCSLLGCLLCIG